VGRPTQRAQCNRRLGCPACMGPGQESGAGPGHGAQPVRTTTEPSVPSKRAVMCSTVCPSTTLRAGVCHVGMGRGKHMGYSQCPATGMACSAPGGVCQPHGNQAASVGAIGQRRVPLLVGQASQRSQLAHKAVASRGTAKVWGMVASCMRISPLTSYSVDRGQRGREGRGSGRGWARVGCRGPLTCWLTCQPHTHEAQHAVAHA
jgi:hypothetical protein